MLSILKLFEVTKYADPAEAPTKERNEYVKQRKATLRKMIGKPGQNTADLLLQLKDIEKTKNDMGWGKTKF